METMLICPGPVCLRYRYRYPTFAHDNAGIGGMAAALTLGMRGHNVTVFEAAPKVCTLNQDKQTLIDILTSSWKLEPGSKYLQTC